jgi:hypothetical protein
MQQFQDLQNSYPNWAIQCELGKLLSPTVDSNGMTMPPLFFDSFQIKMELDNYASKGVNISPYCLLNSNYNKGAFSCNDLYFTEQLSGIYDTVSYIIPSGSDSVIIRGSGINSNRSITIPSTFNKVIWKISGIDCTYNITYNPNTTTIVGSPSGLGTIVNLIQDTNL